MTLTLELTPEEEAILQRQAQDVDVDTLVRARLFRSHVVPPQHPNLTAILDAWIAEDATDDPAEIKRAEQEMEELMQALQQNRVDFGEGHIPDDFE